MSGADERRRYGSEEAAQERDWLDRIPAPAAVLNRAGRVLRCNREAEDVLGLRAGLAGLGRPGVPWFDRLLRLASSPSANGAESARAPAAAMLLVRRRGGRRVLFEVRCRRCAPDELLVLFHDCTDALAQRRASSRRAKDVRARLENIEAQLLQAQKMEVIGRLAAGLAHDFRNMLTAIQGHAQFLLDALPAGTQDHEDAVEIRRAAIRATELSRQLLSFARRQPSSSGTVDVNAVIAGIEKLMRRLVRADTRFNIVLQPDVPPVYADVGQIEQILMNLVVNAREALPGPGVITVRTKYSRHLRPLLPDVNVPPGNYVQLSVSDNGRGMSPTVRSRIFEPFFTTKTEGTGLGLSTVLNLVTEIGGYISVQSEEQSGTTFRIFLPVRD